MRANAGTPCHHPKWPRRCPKCEIQALGFNVVVPIGRRWDPDAQEMRTWAWGTSGMACFKCNKAILPRPEEGGPVSEEYIHSLVKADLPGLIEVSFVNPDLFQTACCLPAEEPENVEALSQ